MSTAEMSATMNAARMLIDARLDAIDRALLGRVSRAERLDVVGEVESRIDELLRERCRPGAEPSRDDVLAVLARLDPPEAYLGDEDEAAWTPRERASLRPASRGDSTAEFLRRRCWLSGVWGLIGIGAVAVCIIAFAVALSVSSVGIYLAGVVPGVVIAVTGGVTAIVLAVKGRFDTGWAFSGMSLGVMSILLGLLFSIGLFGELL